MVSAPILMVIDQMNSNKVEEKSEKNNKNTKYLIVLGLVILSLFFVFPMLINAEAQNPQEKNATTQVALAPASKGTQNLSLEGNIQTITLQVQIPCQGHTQYMIGELSKLTGVNSVKATEWNRFELNFDSTKTSKDQILTSSILNTYPAKVVN
jgi:hypothetical protein